MRSVFVPWSVALGESERLLDDLSSYTKVDGIELLDSFSGIEKASYSSAKRPASRVLPSNRGLDLDLPVVKRDEFKAALKFMGDAKSRGFKITCNSVPLWLGTNTLGDSSLVDVSGRHLAGPRDFTVYGCPNDPEVIRHGDFVMRELVRAWPDMDIMTLDHLEYPHMFLWAYPRVDLESMFTCFCKSCEETALEKGLDFLRMENEAKLLLATLGRGSSLGKQGAPPVFNADDVVNFFLRRPHLAEWLNFRMESMVRYTRSLLAAGREVARECNPKLRFGLDFQLPSLSPLLGTDFLALSFDLDLMIPKFPDYLPGSVIPLFAQEVASRSGLDTGALLQQIRDAFDIGPGPKRYSPYQPYGELRDMLLYSNVFDHSMIARQMKYLKSLVGKIPIQPYIWESNNDRISLRKKIEVSVKRGI